MDDKGSNGNVDDEATAKYPGTVVDGDGAKSHGSDSSSGEKMNVDANGNDRWDGPGDDGDDDGDDADNVQGIDGLVPYPISIDFPNVFVSWNTIDASKEDTRLSSTPLSTSRRIVPKEHQQQGKQQTSCDRRLSRAARSLLVEKLRKAVSIPSSTPSTSFLSKDPHVGGSVDNNPDDYGEDVWTLIARWMDERTINTSITADKYACPLFQARQRDVYRQEELQMSVVYAESFPGGRNYALKAAHPIMASATSKSPSSSSSSSSSWYKCGICGKLFSSRFYLDYHWTSSETCRRQRQLQSHDHYITADGQQEQLEGDQLEKLSSNRVCPATDWCPLVGGMSACHERALRDEPYYDRGPSSIMNTQDRDAMMLVRHKWSKIYHSIPCSVDAIRSDCRSVLESCGLVQLRQPKTLDDQAGRLKPNTADNLCDTLTCPTQQGVWKYLQDETEGLYHWYQGGFSSRESHDYHHEEVWKNQASHHVGLFSSIGLTVVIGLVGWIYSRMRHEYHSPLPTGNKGLGCMNNRRRSSASSGKRLSINTSHQQGTFSASHAETKTRTTSTTLLTPRRKSYLDPRRPSIHVHQE